MKIKGFTIMELLVVTIILGLLLLISLPKFTNSIEANKKSEAIGVLSKMYRGYKILKIENKPTSSASWADLGFDAAPQGNYFNYSYDGTNNIGAAVRKGDSTKWIQIDLDTGTITKTPPY